jgi:hypothetical protein
VLNMKSNRTKLVGLITLCFISSLLLTPVLAVEEYHVIATLQSLEPSGVGWFGSDLALYEGLLLIMEEEADLGDLKSVGLAYIYDSDWNLVATLQAPIPKAQDNFKSADIWGDTIAIGSIADVEDIEFAGEVYIFDSEGVLLTTIQSPEPEVEGNFGGELCLYRDILLVAECYRNDQGVMDAGVVHVFNPEGDFLRTIHSPSPINVGLFGSSIDANDEFILVGETGQLDKPKDEGSVHVYDVDYNLVTTLHSPDNQIRSSFGGSVTVSGDHVVIGERWASVDGHEHAGRAHIYDTGWNLVATLQSPTPEVNSEFGFSVSIGGGLVVVGERKGDIETINEGKAYVFDLEGNLIDTLVSPEPEINAMFGWKVATDGEIIVVADVQHSAGGFSQAGKVHVFGWGEPATEQPALEEEVTVTEPETESEKSGGIPGFPLESIVTSMVLAVLAIWLIQNGVARTPGR